MVGKYTLWANKTSYNYLHTNRKFPKSKPTSSSWIALSLLPPISSASETLCVNSYTCSELLWKASIQQKYVSWVSVPIFRRIWEDLGMFSASINQEAYTKEQHILQPILGLLVIRNTIHWSCSTFISFEEGSQNPPWCMCVPMKRGSFCWRVLCISCRSSCKFVWWWFLTQPWNKKQNTILSDPAIVERICNNRWKEMKKKKTA